MLGTGVTATFCKIAIPAQLHVIAFLLVTNKWHLMRSIYSPTEWTYTCFRIPFYDTFFLSRLPSLPCMHISTHQLRDYFALNSKHSDVLLKTTAGAYQGFNLGWACGSLHWRLFKPSVLPNASLKLCFYSFYFCLRMVLVTKGSPFMNLGFI